MRVSGVLEGIVRAAGRRPGRVLLAVAVAAGIAAALALRLEPSTATETLVGKGSDAYRATEVYRERFGDHAIVVLVRGDLPNLVLTDNLGRLLGLEGCLSGNKPADQPAPGGPRSPCAAFAKTKPVKVVYGPGTFINSAVGEINDQFERQLGSKAQEARRASDAARGLARGQGRSKAEQERAAKAAEQLVYAQFTRDLLQLNLRYGLGLKGLPRLDDPDFVSALVFDPARGATTPKARFAYLFPNARSAVIQVRLKPDLSEAERRRAIGLVRRAVAMKDWQLRNGASYRVTGAPVVVDAGARELRNQTLLLLGVAGLVMALTLLLILPRPLRLLPLAVAVAAGAMTLGLVALFGGSLTVGAIAMLPVLVGLAVDYAIQFQARFNEARAEGAPPGRAVAVAAAGGGPVIGAACLATIAGFAVFALSPSPLVRSFGLLLVIGVALAFAIALTGGLAALGLSAWRGGRTPAPSPRLSRTGGRLQAGGVAAIAMAMSRPGRVLAAGLLLAVCGWVASAGTRVETDIRDLAPPHLKALDDLNELEEETGISGDVNVTVRAADPTSPEVISWAQAFQQRVLSRHGFSSAEPSCAKAQLCPALSLTDFFGGSTSASGTSSSTPAAADVRALVQALPCFISQIVISHRGECSPTAGATPIGDTADIAFGIRVQPLSDQQELIDDIRAQIDPPGGPAPPAGTTIELAGLPVLAAEANRDLSHSRWWLPLAGLVAVAVVLAAIYRSVRRAVIPLLPVLMATGWSGLVVAALGISLNPMSATLGALVIAIATEFSVILSARYTREREAGLPVGEALRRTYLRTGAAVLASGVTAIAGFAVLAIAGIPLLDDIGLISVAPVLRDFGLVTVADLLVALAGVMLVLPAAVVWAEEGFPLPARRRPAPLAPSQSAP